MRNFTWLIVVVVAFALGGPLVAVGALVVAVATRPAAAPQAVAGPQTVASRPSASGCKHETP